MRKGQRSVHTSDIAILHRLGFCTGHAGWIEQGSSFGHPEPSLHKPLAVWRLPAATNMVWPPGTRAYGAGICNACEKVASFVTAVACMYLSRSADPARTHCGTEFRLMSLIAVSKSYSKADYWPLCRATQLRRSISRSVFLLVLCVRLRVRLHRFGSRE